MEIVRLETTWREEHGDNWVRKREYKEVNGDCWRIEYEYEWPGRRSRKWYKFGSAQLEQTFGLTGQRVDTF
jgi:hypothetical protein